MKSIMSVAVLLVAGLVLAQGQRREENASTKIKCQITSIAEDSRSMKCRESKAGGKDLTLKITDRTKVVLDGENAKISRLKKGDRIEATCQRTETPDTYNCTEIRRNKKDNAERQP